MGPSSVASARPTHSLGGSSSSERDRARAAPKVVTQGLPASANPLDASARYTNTKAPETLKLGSISFGKTPASKTPEDGSTTLNHRVHVSSNVQAEPTGPWVSTSGSAHPARESHSSTSKTIQTSPPTTSTSKTQIFDQKQTNGTEWPKLEASWKVTYDPDLDPGPVRRGPTRTRRIAAEGVPRPMQDPRKSSKHASISASRVKDSATAIMLERVHWKWTPESVGAKPKRPPSALVVTNILPMVPSHEVKQHFDRFGYVERIDLKLDPLSAASLGIAYVCYKDGTYWDHKTGDYVTRPMEQNGGAVARKAVNATHNQRIGRAAMETDSKSGLGVVRCHLDFNDTKGKPEAEREVQHRLQKKKAEAAKLRAREQSKAANSAGKSHVQDVKSRDKDSPPDDADESASKKIKVASPSPSSNRNQLRDEAVQVVLGHLREKMYDRMVSQYSRVDIEEHLRKRLKVDKKALSGKESASTKPKAPHAPSSTATPHHAISNSGNMVEHHHIAPPLPLTLPPRSPIKSGLKPPQPFQSKAIKPLPGVAPPSLLPGPSSLGQPSKEPFTAHLSKLPSFSRIHQLPKIQSNRPSPLPKPKSLLSRPALDDRSNRTRKDKRTAGGDSRAVSPASSLSSAHSASASHEAMASDTDDTEEEESQSEEDAEDGTESIEDTDGESAKQIPRKGQTQLPSVDEQRHSKHHTKSVKPRKDIGWSDDSDSDAVDADLNNSPIVEKAPKRQLSHVVTNGHGVKQVGSLPHAVKSSPKKEDVHPPRPFVSPTVILHDELLDDPTPVPLSEKTQETSPVNSLKDDHVDSKQTTTKQKKKVPPPKSKKAPAHITGLAPENLTPLTPKPPFGPHEPIPETPALFHGRDQEEFTALGDPFELQAETPGGIDLYREGLVADEEDFYYLRQVLQRIKEGLSMHPDPSMLQPQINEDELDLPVHSTGSARTEGYYKRAAGEKAAYLPQRNKAMVEVGETNANSTAISRSSRAESRRAALSGSSNATSDSDIIKFNQLKSRGKLLKFARSPIHDWGLYALERIDRGDLVIEYIGELIRQQIADMREMAYERSGIGSSYLFRIDDDFVVDATKKGSMSRLINHSCNPNCIAKIITINGVKKIVIYARQTIEPGDEITYDYKFAVEAAEFKIPCLCGASNCRRYLN